MIFGQKLRELREKNCLVLRKVAAELDIDTATMSKIERGDRSAKKKHLPILANLFKISQEELKTLWLADKICDLVSNEDVAIKALKRAESELKVIK